MRVIGAIQEFDSDDHANMTTRASKYGPVKRRRPQFIIELEIEEDALRKYNSLDRVRKGNFRDRLGCTTHSPTNFVCRVDNARARTAEAAVELLMKTARDLLSAL